MAGKKDKPINILIIDDDSDYVASLQNAARAPEFRIRLVHYQSLEGAKEHLATSQGRSIAGAILDVVCMKTKAQEIPDKSFITEALRFFETTYPKLPKVVLTGEPDEYKNLKDLYQGTYQIYDKSSGERDLLEMLKAQSSQLDFVQMSQKYPDVFEVFEDGLLDADARDEFIECIKTMSSSDSNEHKKCLTFLRRLQERIYDAIGKSTDMIPGDVLEGGCGGVLYYLRDKDLADSVINQAGYMVYKVACDHGAHTPRNAPLYTPTKYTTQSLVFAMMDLLLWMKGIVAGETRQ